MKFRNLFFAVLVILFSCDLWGEGIKINRDNLKNKKVVLKKDLSNATNVRMFTDFNGKHYLLGYYPNNKIKIVPIGDSTYYLLISSAKTEEESIVKEARVPFVIYEFFSNELYADLLLATYSRYGINNAPLSVVTFPIMTATGIIVPLLYTSHHEISYGEMVHSYTSNVYGGALGGATNYLITGKFEPLTALLSSVAGNIGGYWMAKEKRYSPGRALIYDEVLQKTSYISISASTVYQGDSIDGKIVAGAFVGATVTGAISSYLLADRFGDMKVGDIFLLNGLSNSFSAVFSLITLSITDNPKVVLPVSYTMFIPGYYAGYRILKTGHISTQDGIILNLGIYAGYLLGGAADALLNSLTGYDKFIGTAAGGVISTFLMYNWVKNRTSQNVIDTKIGFDFNPIPIVSCDINKNYTYSFNKLITLTF